MQPPEKYTEQPVLSSIPPVRLPAFLRVLIIDDEIAHNSCYHEFFTSFFIHRASQHPNPRFRIPAFRIDVQIEQYPERGIERWASECFDLTLIDLDFSHTRRATQARKADPHSHLAFNAQRQGMTVLRQIHDWLYQEGGRFAYRQKGMDVYLWSGVAEDDIERQLKAYGIEEQSYILPKYRPGGSTKAFEDMTDRIDNCCQRIVQQNFSPDQQLERLLQALRRGFFDSRDDPLAGFVIKSGDGVRWPGQPGSPYTVVLKARCNIQTDDVFLPLCGRITARPEDGGLRLDDLVTYMKDPSKGSRDIHDICQAYHTPVKAAASSDSSAPTGKQHHILGYRFKNCFWAAATPLTGTTVIGEDQAIAALKDKINQLLNGPFGGVVLKTAYLDRPAQWDHTCWPGLHIQSHVRTRCLYPLADSPTLWNTGRTALETLPPRLLNRFLREFAPELKASAPSDQQAHRNGTHRLIVSLGSKFHPATLPFTQFSADLDLQAIWETLFDQVFDGICRKDYPLVEINARHFLREIISRWLGGDEYLSPASLNEISHADMTRFYEEYRKWLQVIHRVAVARQKQLILKFPFRSDTLALIREAVALRKWHLAQSGPANSKRDYGVRGITLINALKTPVPVAGIDDPPPHTPAWYASHSAWGDASGKQWKYQMSGAQLSTGRNQLLAGMVQKDIPEALKDLGIVLFFSGGVMSPADLRFLQQHFKGLNGDGLDYGIQIGSWALLHGNLKAENWFKAEAPPRVRQRLLLDKASCRSSCCKNKESLCPEHNIIETADHKLILDDPTRCKVCQAYPCLKGCNSSSLRLTVPPFDRPDMDHRTSEPSRPRDNHKEKRITPRICLVDMRRCTACGTCMQTFYCDAFLNRDNTLTPPHHDPRHCAGCGLCAQLCPSGALRLYRPNELFILLTDTPEPHHILQQRGIPHICYHPHQDLERISLLDTCDRLTRLLETQRLLTYLQSAQTTGNGPVNPNETLEEVMDQWITRLWKIRQPEQFILGYGRDEYNGDDQRSRRAGTCQDAARDMYAELKAPVLLAKLRALIYGLMWSQLFWSDPGQIFWDTPIRCLSTCLVDKNGQPVSAFDDNLSSGCHYRVRTFLFEARAGKCTLVSQDSPRFTFTGFPDWYQSHKLGLEHVNRLDVRGYGHWLIEDYDRFNDKEILELWGLPHELLKRGNGKPI